jgi:hypothetical protein
MTSRVVTARRWRQMKLRQPRFRGASGSSSSRSSYLAISLSPSNAVLGRSGVARQYGLHPCESAHAAPRKVPCWDYDSRISLLCAIRANLPAKISMAPSLVNQGIGGDFKFRKFGTAILIEPGTSVFHQNRDRPQRLRKIPE